MYINKYQKEHRSFTLIELLVAMGIFTFVILSVLGIYVMTIQKHFQAQKIQVVNEELRYVMELISRDTRDSLVVGKKSDSNYEALYLDHPTKKSTSSSCSESETLDESNCLVYKIIYNDTSGEICRGGAGSSCVAVNDIGGSGGATYFPLTSSRIEIEEDSQFLVSADAVDNGNWEQDNPLVTILIKSKAKNDREGISEIILQTSVSQKELENKYKGYFY